MTFDTVSSFRDAERLVNDNQDSPRPLSPKILPRVYVPRRTDRPDEFHVVAHCITDAPSMSTILRSFSQTLATSFDPFPTSIEERLQMYCPVEIQVFPNGVPLVKRGWRKAVGYAFYIVRRAQLTVRGGLFYINKGISAYT